MPCRQLDGGDPAGIASSFTVAETFTACGGPTISVSAIVPGSALQST